MTPWENTMNTSISIKSKKLMKNKKMPFSFNLFLFIIIQFEIGNIYNKVEGEMTVLIRKEVIRKDMKTNIRCIPSNKIHWINLQDVIFIFKLFTTQPMENEKGRIQNTNGMNNTLYIIISIAMILCVKIFCVLYEKNENWCFPSS